MNAFKDSNPESTELIDFGELKVGDQILGSNGELVSVVQTYDPHIPERMYALELDNGEIIEASGNHLWYIEPQSDKLEHLNRLKKSKKLLKTQIDWETEALFVAESSEQYEIGFEDLMNFFDFIEEYDIRYYFLLRVAESIGHIVEEEVTLQDYFTNETTAPSFEKIYDARRFFQQTLALTGKRKYRKRWPVIVGRVVTTDTLFHQYQDADIPSLKNS